MLSCSPVLNLLSFIPNKYAKDIAHWEIIFPKLKKNLNQFGTVKVQVLLPSARAVAWDWATLRIIWRGSESAGDMWSISSIGRAWSFPPVKKISLSFRYGSFAQLTKKYLMQIQLFHATKLLYSLLTQKLNTK